MSTPAVAVAVASHERPIRLRWLLDALGEQTLPPERFEVVVAHDSAGPATAELLEDHPLTSAGTLRSIAFAPGPGPAVKRNAAWRAARAPVVAFTDDDCRPPAEWLERLLGAARAAPEAIVQGATVPDPDEAHLLHAAPGARSQEVAPPTMWAQTCNILYPRELLERLGGFDERLPIASWEDADLALRARAAGAIVVAAPEAITFHAVQTPFLMGRLRSRWRWGHLAFLVARHAEVRDHLVLGVFWKRSHPFVLLALAGLAAAGAGRRWATLAALPWVIEARPRYGPSLRGRLRSLSELPSAAVGDLVEVLGLARGSVRYRALVL